MFSWWFKPRPVSWARLVSRLPFSWLALPGPGPSSLGRAAESPDQKAPARAGGPPPSTLPVPGRPQRGALVACGPIPASEMAHSPHFPRDQGLRLDRKAVLASAEGPSHPPSCGSLSRSAIISTLGSESLPGGEEGLSGPSSWMAAEPSVSGSHVGGRRLNPGTCVPRLRQCLREITQRSRVLTLFPVSFLPPVFTNDLTC